MRMRFTSGKSRVLLAGLALVAMMAAMACGGTSSKDKTATAAAKQPTAAVTKSASASTATSGGTSTTGLGIPSNVGKDDKAQLTGAGATFPNPLYTRWFSDYKASIATGVEVNYQSIGSGGGVKQITEKTVDFGASDAPLSDAELAKAAGVQHIPTTSYVFTDYLSSASSDWKSGPGTSKNPQWPVGLGGQGNEGVTQQVKQNKNSIGYVELLYAVTNKLPQADIKSKTGDYVAASSASTSLAASGVTLPADYRISIVDSATKGAYPIASFTYILLYKDQKDAAKGKALVDLLWWAIHDGQKTTTELNYAPLPADVVTSIEKTLTTDITSGGQPLLKK